ncbi:hypothetical protein [Micromonospora cathayae]|uniref:NACHT domain-containing protein n=1 Tax=Micromonospora cathayae TaxID=3028804 RepID=A0ABY7ZKU1_9ACTN|nr:hypothetical protein [Micromonospora sp. HUAS 3]WDZ83600.1 hypothetical protein PVK37_24515 [Micromonospora sp. HUAS 3]
MPDNIWPAVDTFLWRARFRAGRTFVRRATVGLPRRAAGRLVTWLPAAVSAALILGGLALAVDGKGLVGTAADLSVNVAASVVVGAAAVVTFVVTARRQALRRLLAVQRVTSGAGTDRPTDRVRQAGAIAAQLTDVGQSGSIVIEASAGSGRTSFLRQLVTVLSERGVVAIELDEADLTGASVVQAATERFGRLMAHAGVDAPLLRTMELLAKQRRIVVLVDGLDCRVHLSRRSSAAEAIRRRLDELSAAHLAHVAVIGANATPPEALAARIRLAPISHTALLSLVTRGAAPSRTTDGLLRRIGSDLRHLRLSLHTLRAAAADMWGDDADDEALLRTFAARIDTDGPTALLLRRLPAGVAAPAVLARRSTTPEPVAVVAWAALDRVVEHLLVHDTSQASWSDLVDGLDWSRVDGFLLGVIELERRSIVQRQERDSDQVIRFLDPELRELVVGIRLAGSVAAFRHSVARGGPAFTGELLERTAAADDGTREAVWRAGCEAAVRSGLLSAVGDAARALNSFGVSPPELSVDLLGELWEAADDAERSMFVNRLPGVLPTTTMDYLWSRLRAPLFNRTGHGLRRDIARALQSRGEAAWRRLGPQWEEAVRAAESGGLAWRDRRGPVWRRHGNALASLGWILPAVTIVVEGDEAVRVVDLLRRFAETTVPGGDLIDDGRADLGLEISLAEGCKDAAHVVMQSGRRLPDEVWTTAVRTVRAGRAWVSRLVALQACVLGAAAEPARISLVRHLLDEGSADGHPVTRDYSRLLADVVRTGGGDLGPDVYRSVWPDDTDALATAGNELDDGAARVLAVTTIVLNLLEARLRVAEPDQTGTRLRVGALTNDALPGCLVSRLLAHGADTGRCGCELGLCGSELRMRSLRPMSRPFAHRCLTGGDAKRTGYDRALDVHLGRIVRS